MEYTPGPWKWFNYPDGRKLLSARTCAVVHCPDAPLSVGEADAHLIAAAPELLAELERVASIAEDWIHSELHGTKGYEAALATLAPAHAIIAKARGIHPTSERI